MERNHFWMFLIAGVAFGLCMEVIKHVDLTSPRTQILDSRELVADDSSDGGGYGGTSMPKRIQAAFPKRRDLQQSGEMNARVGGLAPDWGASAEAQANNGEGTGPQKQGEQKPKTEAEKKKEKEAAEKKKKEEEKKKKKKKKKKVPGQPESKDSQDSDDDEKDKSDDKDGSGNAMNDVGPGAIAGGAPLMDPNGIPQTLEEWEAYVLKDPDFKKTSTLIKYYQTSLVKAEIFYAVVDQMLDDSRTEMRELGVMALGQTPSARSFAMLTGVLYEEQGNTTLKTHVKTYMRHYMQLQNLKYLANAMSMESDPHSSYEALRLFRIAADYHLKQLANQQPTTPTEQGNGGTGTGGTGTSPRQPATSSVTRYFDPFVNILTSLSQTSHDASFRQEANQALDNLQTLLAQRPA